MKKEKARKLGKEEARVIKELKSADEYFRKGDIERGVRAYYSIGESLEKAGRRKEARGVYLRAGEILRQQKAWDYAAEMYKKAEMPEAIASLYSQAAITSQDENERRKYAGLASNVYTQLAETMRAIGEGRTSSGLEEVVEGEKPKKRVAAILLMFFGFVFAVLFLGNFTGLSIGSESNSSIIGVVFFVLGIIGALLYLRKKE